MTGDKINSIIVINEREKNLEEYILMQSRSQNFSWKSGSSILFPDSPFRLVSNKNTDVTGVVFRQCPVTIKLKGASVKGKLMYIMIL